LPIKDTSIVKSVWSGTWPAGPACAKAALLSAELAARMRLFTGCAARMGLYSMRER